MLVFTLIRAYRKADYTIGRLYQNGQFVCNTVEDTDRGLNQFMTAAQVKKIKVAEKTAIPVGTYKLDVSMSPKFKRRLIHVLDVPGYTGIRVHRGTNADSSAGCLIVGENKIKGGVVNSAKYEEMLTQTVDNALKNKDEVYLTII